MPLFGEHLLIMSRVPIYSIASFVSIKSTKVAMFVDPVRDIYEVGTEVLFPMIAAD
jgi:hypothetical protein